MTSTRCSATNLRAFFLRLSLATLASRALQVGDSLHGNNLVVPPVTATAAVLVGRSTPVSNDS
jgi:hypothetical protein